MPDASMEGCVCMCVYVRVCVCVFREGKGEEELNYQKILGCHW